KAATPLIWPLVLDHNVISDGAPCAAKCKLPEISPSFMTLGPAILAQVTFSPVRPACAACFSTSACFSITISGRKLTPYCWAMVISLTSARAMVDTASAAQTAIVVLQKRILASPGQVGDETGIYPAAPVPATR